MPEESTTPDLVELVRRRMDAGDSGDADAMTALLKKDIAQWAEYVRIAKIQPQ